MSRRLLVVDDEVELLVIIVKLARDRGYDAIGTIDPKDVLSRIRAAPPDVMLLDLRMPGLDGRDLLSQLVYEPSAPAVIVMSGWVDEYTEALCRAYGVADVVRKPFEIDELFERIEVAARAGG